MEIIFFIGASFERKSLIKNELYKALSYIENRMIFSTDLQQKVVQTVQKLEHLGITKTKQMMRATYRFPNIKAMIDQMKGHCFDCNVTTENRRQEQAKPFVSVISKDP